MANARLAGFSLTELPPLEETAITALCLVSREHHRPIPWGLSQNSCGTCRQSLRGEGRCETSKTR